MRLTAVKSLRLLLLRSIASPRPRQGMMTNQCHREGGAGETGLAFFDRFDLDAFMKLHYAACRVVKMEKRELERRFGARSVIIHVVASKPPSVVKPPSV